MMLPDNELKELETRAAPALELLRVELEDMIARMQSAKARDAVAAVGIASIRELGEAAVKGFMAQIESNDD